MLLEGQGVAAIPHDGTKLVSVDRVKANAHLRKGEKGSLDIERVNVDHDDEVNESFALACLFSCVVLFHIS